jgi:membrane protein DedA with SNARE-associated domain
LHNRGVLIGIGIVAVVVVVAFLLHQLGGGDGFSGISEDGGDHAYLVLFLVVFGDAICALLPGETAVNSAATLAADGTLDLGLVMLAAALGAVLGDSALYWIARRSSGRIGPRLERAKRNDKVSTALAFLGTGGPVLLVAGRYVPGLRFVVNATMGLSEYPYRRFLLWSAIGGTTWAIYTAGLAYLIGMALADFPVASIVISGLFTTVVIGAIFFVIRRHQKSGPTPPPVPASEPAQ